MIITSTLPTAHVFHSPRLGQLLSQALETASDEAEAGVTGAWAAALLGDALRERASDIHLDSQREAVRIRFRIDGAINDVVTLSTVGGERLLRSKRTRNSIPQRR